MRSDVARLNPPGPRDAIDGHGEEVEKAVNRSCDDIFMVMQAMEKDLDPLLTEDQRKALGERGGSVESDRKRRRQGRIPRQR